MSQEWVKIEKCTPEKPEVYRMSALLKTGRDDVFGKLMRVWMYFDSQTTDGVMRGADCTFLDMWIGRTGFCDAMKQVGWLKEYEGNLILPNFDRHNGESAKRRALTARRVERHRGKGVAAVTHVALQDCAPCNAVGVTRVEESRGEENSPLSPPKGEHTNGLPSVGKKRRKRGHPHSTPSKEELAEELKRRGL